MELNNANTKYLDLRIYHDEDDSKHQVTHISLEVGESKFSCIMLENSYEGDPYNKGENGREGLIKDIEALINRYFEYED